MEITKVTADKNYKFDYIKIDNSVYRLSDALSLYPEFKHAILKTASKELKSAAVEHLTLKHMPSDMKIVELIERERKEVYKKLGLKETTSLKEKARQARLLLVHLASNLTYYTPIKEEVKKQYNQAYDKAIFKQGKKFTKTELLLKAVKEELKNNPNDKELFKKQEMYADLIKYHKYKMMKIYEAQIAEHKIADKRHELQSIYKAFIEKKGVCFDFSLAYSYLLTGLNIENKCVSLRYKEDKKNDDVPFNYHMINLVGLKQDENKNTKYSFVDVTDVNYILEMVKQIEHSEANLKQFLIDQVNGTNNLEEFHEVYPNNVVYRMTEFNKDRVYFTKNIENKNEIAKIMANMVSGKELEQTL